MIQSIKTKTAQVYQHVYSCPSLKKKLKIAEKVVAIAAVILIISCYRQDEFREKILKVRLDMPWFIVKKTYSKKDLSQFIESCNFYRCNVYRHYSWPVMFTLKSLWLLGWLVPLH